jgi:vitamin B12 transporter
LSKIKFLFCLFVCLTIVWQDATAQDTSTVVPEVIIYGSRLEVLDAGTKLIQPDSLTLHRTGSLASVLEQHSSIYIKSYGLGSLATTAFRGANASQTAVLWNGFNLQSPMNGTLDLALVPAGLLDQVQVKYGGGGALWGSGAIAGSVHLANKERFGQGLSVGYTASYGSFRRITQLADVSVSKKNIYSSLRLYWSDAQNDFPYTNDKIAGKPRVHQTNAMVQQYGYMFDNAFRIGRRHQWNIRVWQQDNKRNIPPTMLVPFADAVQRDWFLRISSEWQHTRRRSVWNVRGAYMDEKIRFQENKTNLDSYSRSLMYVGEAETKWTVSTTALVHAGINYTYTTADVNSYRGKPFQHRTALFTSFKYSDKKNIFRANAGVRKELMAGTLFETPRWVPWMPFAGADVHFLPHWKLRMNVSRNYRLPTFNDLFWVPGGNSALLPEQGWAQEAGIVYSSKKRNQLTTTSAARMNVQGSSTVFSRHIHNWIMWLPEGSYWTPRNIMEVWSRGLENTLDLSYRLRKITIHAGGRYDYILSTAVQVAPGQEAELGKQLIYVPLHKGSIQMGIAYKGYELHYTHHYTGWVYTSSDNASFLEPYWLGNIVLSKEFHVKNHTIVVWARGNNIWNKTYQVIAMRPMPGIHAELGIRLRFNKK